jgi:MOSC domain-containing protein YiiM
VAKILAVCISATTGVRKTPVTGAEAVAGHGLRCDAHAGGWHRQVSLLAAESIAMMRAKGLDLGWGDFGENVVTEGIELKTLPVGARLRTGAGVLLEITQIGKICHEPCAIYATAGECIMPAEGIFCRVLNGGMVRPGDSIDVVSDSDSRAQ